MPHINTEPGDHDVTASAFIVRLDTPEPTMMLHWHKFLETYLQFGGHVEKYENPWQTIIHELVEEAGYEIAQLRILQPKLSLAKLTGVQIHPVPVYLLTHKFNDLDHYHTDIGFGFTAYHPPTKPVAEGESEKVVNFSIDQLRSLPSDKIPEDVREIGLYLLEKCLDDWVPIPTNKWESRSQTLD